MLMHSITCHLLFLCLADSVRIIKDFYLLETDETLRPKIFGMTASPVDAKVDVIRAAR